MSLTLPDVLFWLLAVVTGVSAIGVVVTQNVVRAATWLLFALAGTAGIFFVLGADFIGATQLLIYVGGTLVLVVFGVMLTAQGPFINMRVSGAEWAIGMAVGLLLYGVLAFVMAGVTPEKTLALSEGENNPPASLPPSKHLGVALLGGRQAAPGDRMMTGAREARKRERTRMGYLLPFEIVSVHLLVVLIGAAYLARAKRRRAAAVPPDAASAAPMDRREAVTAPVAGVERH
jgi:NADH-quinone oxidoreductase subunit J